MSVYNIVPQAKLPRNISGQYSYNSKFDLKAGALVSVEFRKSIVLGIVTGKAKNKTGGYKLKEVNKIVGQTPLYISELLLWLSNYYFSSQAFIWLMMSPPPPKRLNHDGADLTKQNSATLPKKLFATLKTKQSNLKVIRSYLNSQNVLIENSHLDTADKLITYFKLIERVMNKGQSVILLSPTLDSLKIIENHLPPYWRDRIVRLTSEIYTRKLKYWYLWKKILTSDDPLIILGTRSAIFAPLNNLGLIIIDQAESDDFKQYDQNPRYDARHVAIKVRELTKCDLKMFSQGIIL